MVLNLYLNLFSSSCRSLYIFAKLHVISFEMIPVDLMKAEHHSKEFVQISPLKKVPVMKDEDFVLGESVAIMLYLCRRFKTPDHWYPDDAEGCALVDEYLAWQHLNMKKHCKKVLWMKMMIPHFFKHHVPHEKLEEAMTELSHSLDLLKNKFLKDKPFLTGDRISLADLMALEDMVQVGIAEGWAELGGPGMRAGGREKARLSSAGPFTTRTHSPSLSFSICKMLVLLALYV
uniref:GST N-terminal domain-containing protein n=1 Tax=Vombatus ursinus TaxID=29139 RepID=A0A4X2LDR6_VOMUR